MLTLTEEMFKNGQPFAQGEVLLWMRKYAPEAVLNDVTATEFKVYEPEDSKVILGHSETGHHHVLEAIEGNVLDAADIRVGVANDNYMTLEIKKPCRLVHMRQVDNHEGFLIPPGDYIRRIREENTVDGWVRVAD
jgi:hypothetical protein